MLKVKNDFEWNRSYSAMRGAITIKAGAKVQKKGDTYYVASSYFTEDKILLHDAIHYGCRVAADNVIQED